MPYLYLAIAIIAEVIATSSLKASEGFTRLLPGAISVVGYVVAFYFLSLVLKTIPVGVAYAIWAGLGIVLVAAVAALRFEQLPDGPALLGMFLIISGVIVINLFSESVHH
jgi:small multidrug resistance pump